MSLTFLWVSKFYVSWGWGTTIFEITLCTRLFKYFDPNLSLFFCFFCAFIRFDENFKKLIWHAELKKVLFQTCHFFFVFIEFIRFFIQRSATRWREARDAISIYRQKKKSSSSLKPLLIYGAYKLIWRVFLGKVSTRN